MSCFWSVFTIEWDVSCRLVACWNTFIQCINFESFYHKKVQRFVKKKKQGKTSMTIEVTEFKLLFTAGMTGWKMLLKVLSGDFWKVSEFPGIPKWKTIFKPGLWCYLHFPAHCLLSVQRSFPEAVWYIIWQETMEEVPFKYPAILH